MTPYLKELFHNQQWRESENVLIEELVRLCEAGGVGVWVNLSSNMFGDWKRLTKRGEQVALAEY